MRKTINCKIAVIISMLLFSCFWSVLSVKAATGESITLYSNIYNASGVINASFEYTIEADSGNPAGAQNEPTAVTVKFNNVSPEGNLTTQTAQIDFAGASYVTPGIYKYKVREVAASSSEYALSGEQYEIYVVVADGVKTVYQQAMNLNDKTKGNLNFNHEPEYTFIKIDAVTLGDAVDKAEYFRFRLQIDSLCIGCEYEIIGQDEYVKYNGQMVRTVGRYVAGESEAPTYIYLKNGQSVTIGLASDGRKQIPLGTRVQIFGDENLNKRKWTMMMDGEEVDSLDYVVGGQIVIEIVMERDMLVPNTGLFGEAWPFILLILSGGFGFWVYRKLKKHAG